MELPCQHSLREFDENDYLICSYVLYNVLQPNTNSSFFSPVWSAADLLSVD